MGKKVFPALAPSYSSPTTTNRVMINDEDDISDAKTYSKPIARSQSLISSDADPG